MRRHISPDSGRALEVLGHAIEYLADECAFTAAQMGILNSGDPRVEAIQLLMLLNRQVYYSCPKVEPVLRRFAGWLFGSTPAPQQKQPSREREVSFQPECR